MLLGEIKKSAQTRMQKSVEALHNELVKIRTGRAHPSLLDHVTVSYYGADVPLSQVASVTVSDARTLAVAPWEKTMVQPIEKAIMQADLGLNPATSGQLIRVPLPPLTEERRKDLTKIVKNETENTRVAIRNIRRDANSETKTLLKDKKISEDEERQMEDEIQKMTNQFIGEAEKVLAAKEVELMAV